MKIKSLVMMMLVAVFALSSCGKKGDKEIEKQFVGSWTMSTSTTEDGMRVELEGTITYNEDNTFEQEAVIMYPQISYDAYITMYQKGTWYATKDMIYEEIDKSSIILEFSEDFLDLSDMSKSEATDAFLSDMKSEDLKTEGKIISLGSDKITLKEDGEIYSMYRR